jgi:sugar/nucleoside kinase (ribokinase family)
MNREEAELISGKRGQEAIEWLREAGPDPIVVTRGEFGALVVAGGEIEEIPAANAKVVFDIGAGDTFHAAFLTWWTSGSDPIESARFAAQAAALKISRPPQIDQLPTRAEVLTALHSDGKSANRRDGRIG